MITTGVEVAGCRYPTREGIWRFKASEYPSRETPSMAALQAAARIATAETATT